MKDLRFPAVLAASVLVLPAPAAPAQIGPGSIGFHWTGSTGPSVGTICSGVSCTPFTTHVTVGETVTIDVRGMYNGSYLVGFSTSATRCLSIPGFYNALIIDDPITILFSGTLNLGDPILACPGGRAIIQVVMPSLPTGVTFDLQAAAATFGSGSQWALSSAIHVNVL